MAQRLDIRLETCIDHVEQTSNGWSLFDKSGQNVGNYDRLLITIPATQAADLIAASHITGDLRDRITALLRKARYNPLLSVMLGYKPTPRARPYYALVNTDKAHAISWLAWEHEKSPARVPEYTGLLIAQMAPQYSQENWERPQQEIATDVATRVAALINEPLPGPIFTDLKPWRHALPIEKTDANTRSVFGDYISIYDIQRAVEDKATVPIYYESRLAKLELDAEERAGRAVECSVHRCGAAHGRRRRDHGEVLEVVRSTVALRVIGRDAVIPQVDTELGIGED